MLLLLYYILIYILKDFETIIAFIKKNIFRQTTRSLTDRLIDSMGVKINDLFEKSLQLIIEKKVSIN